VSGGRHIHKVVGATYFPGSDATNERECDSYFRLARQADQFQVPAWMTRSFGHSTTSM